MEKETKTTKAKEKELTPKMICNSLKIQGNYKNFVLKKYKNKKLTLTEWKNFLKQDGLDF